MGAEFAVGFLYGMNAGGFDDKELYKCLQNELDADKAFLDADVKLKTALNNNDPNLAIESLTGMIGFVALMASGQDAAGNMRCPVFGDADINWDDISSMILIMQDPDLDFQYIEEEGAFIFNQQDISGDID